MPSAPVLTVFSLVGLCFPKTTYIHTAVEHKKGYRLYHTFFTLLAFGNLAINHVRKHNNLTFKHISKPKV